MGPLACLSLLSFFTRRKIASPKGASPYKAVGLNLSSSLLSSVTPLPLRGISPVRRRKLRILRFRPRAKSSVTSLLLLSPPNQVAQPSAALLRYGCGIPLAGTYAGLRRGPHLRTTKFPPTQGAPVRGAVSAFALTEGFPGGFSLTARQNTTPLPPPSPPRPLSAAPFSAQTPSGCPQKCCRPM